ncbi:MAG: GH1 family beta-glucosidase [Acidimicrobiia bacterium]
MQMSASSFPEDFAWGVATAAYQIEGAAEEGGRGPSIWDTFSHTPGKTRNGESGDIAVDHYHRFRDDVSLMADIGVNSYRFSISWSRLIANGVGEVNPEGVAFYRNLCTELLDNGIKPIATLYHWDLPQALQDRGGWANLESADWFAEYAATAVESLGDLVHTWATLNEPWCTAFLGHSLGEHAPGVQDVATSFTVAHHLMLAHHRAIEAMKEVNQSESGRFGIVLNLIPAWPERDVDGSDRAADGIDAVQNLLFADAVLDGTYPDAIRDIHERLGLDHATMASQLKEAQVPIDFLGVNYYNVNHIAFAPGAPAMGAWPGIPEAKVARPPGDLTSMGWGVEPDGLTWMLERIHEWAPGLPLMIMENGAAYPDVVGDDGGIADPERTEYIQLHIAAVRRAMNQGVNVEGYFVWSLLDNFEWAKGYSMRFGIVRVDYDTMERTMKDSALWYKSFLAS